MKSKKKKWTVERVALQAGLAAAGTAVGLMVPFVALFSTNNSKSERNFMLGEAVVGGLIALKVPAFGLGVVAIPAAYFAYELSTSAKKALPPPAPGIVPMIPGANVPVTDPTLIR